MNLIEHLLTCLGEEGAEIAQQASKSNRFGLTDVNFKVPNGPDNRERLVTELNQLLATADMCADAGIIPKDWRSNAKATDIRIAKREAVETCMNYAQMKGALVLHRMDHAHSPLGRMVQVTLPSGRRVVGVVDAVTDGAMSLRDAADVHTCKEIGNFSFRTADAEWRFV